VLVSRLFAVSLDAVHRRRTGFGTWPARVFRRTARDRHPSALPPDEPAELYAACVVDG
jgi:hypothetical protein